MDRGAAEPALRRHRIRAGPRRHLAHTSAEARTLLAMAADPAGDADPAQLPELIAALQALLVRMPGAGSQQLAADHRAALERLRQRFDARVEALGRANRAVK